MNAIPPEVLALIFKQACPPVFPEAPCNEFSMDSYPILTLSHVSSHWRQVAWLAPHLWCDLSLFVPKLKGNTEGVIPILELHLQNARNLPFNLELDFETEDQLGNFELFDRITNSIENLIFNNAYSKNLRSLRLMYAPLNWPFLIVKQCSQLQHLSIISYGHTIDTTPPRDKLSLAPLTTLRYVCLDSIQRGMILPWSSITELELESIPIDSCVESLVKCTKLTRFSSFYPINPQAAIEDMDLLHSPIVLEALTEFTWSLHPDEEFYTPLLQNIRLPVLRSLCWSGWGSGQTVAEPGARAMFSNLPDTLHTLRLEYLYDWTHDLFRYAFTQARSVRELAVHTSQDQITQTLLDVLCPAQDETNRTKYLPSLTTLTIQDSYQIHPVPELLDETFSHQILKLCKTRFSDPHSRFRIVLQNFTVVWGEGVQEELAAMVGRGLQLEVVYATNDGILDNL